MLGNNEMDVENVANTENSPVVLEGPPSFEDDVIIISDATPVKFRKKRRISEDGKHQKCETVEGNYKNWHIYN